MATSVLLSTLLMGLVLIAIVAGILRLRQWRHGPTVDGGTTFLERSIHSPTAWAAGFVVLALGFGLAVVAVASGATGALPEDFWGLLTIFLVPFLVLLGLYVFTGIYSSARDRGLSNAPAVGLASAVIGLLVLVAVVMMLLTDPGA